MIAKASILLCIKPYLLKFIQIPNYKNNSFSDPLFHDLVIKQHYWMLTKIDGLQLLLTKLPDCDIYETLKLIYNSNFLYHYKTLNEKDNFLIKVKYGSKKKVRRNCIDLRNDDSIKLMNKELQWNFISLGMSFIHEYHYKKSLRINQAVNQYCNYLNITEIDLKKDSLKKKLTRNGLKGLLILIKKYKERNILFDYNSGTTSIRDLAKKYDYSKNTVNKICNDEQLQNKYSMGIDIDELNRWNAEIQSRINKFSI